MAAPSAATDCRSLTYPATAKGTIPQALQIPQGTAAKYCMRVELLPNVSAQVLYANPRLSIPISITVDQVLPASI